MIVNRRSPTSPFFLAMSALLIAAPESIAQPLPVATGTCRPWADSGGDHSNTETPDTGCTNRRNLENMLESKADLEHGRMLGPADAERESLAIKNYREGKVKESGTGASSSGALLIPTVKSPESGQ